MKCDADFHKNLCTDIVLSSGGNVSFQSATNYDADTPQNVLVSTDMSTVPVEVVVAKTSIEESSLQWRLVQQCRVDKGHEHILQSATKCDADNRRNSHAIRWSFLSPSRGHVELRKSSSKCSWWDSQQPSLHSLSSEVSQAKQRRVDFSSAGCLLDCAPKRQGRELLRRRPCVPTSSRSFALEVLRRTIHSFSLLHSVGFPWEHFQCFLLSPFWGTEQRVPDAHWNPSW